jgi:hypothetical protein
MTVDVANGRALATDVIAGTVESLDLVIGERVIIGDRGPGEDPLLSAPQAIAWHATEQRALIVDAFHLSRC